MHGSGVFFDARLGNKGQYPIAAKSGSGNMRGTPDQVTSKLAALHFYQLAIAAPTPPAISFDADAGVMMQSTSLQRRLVKPGGRSIKRR
jgi:hypothetical protein